MARVAIRHRDGKGVGLGAVCCTGLLPLGGVLTPRTSPPPNDMARCNGGEAMLSHSGSSRVTRRRTSTSRCRRPAARQNLCKGIVAGMFGFVKQDSRKGKGKKDMDVSAIRLPPANPVAGNDMENYITGLGPARLGIVGDGDSGSKSPRGASLLGGASLLDGRLECFARRWGRTRKLNNEPCHGKIRFGRWRFPCLQLPARIRLEMGQEARCGPPPSLPPLHFTFLFGHQAEERERRCDGKTIRRFGGPISGSQLFCFCARFW